MLNNRSRKDRGSQHFAWGIVALAAIAAVAAWQTTEAQVPQLRDAPAQSTPAPLDGLRPGPFDATIPPPTATIPGQPNTTSPRQPIGQVNPLTSTPARNQPHYGDSTPISRPRLPGVPRKIEPIVRQSVEYQSVPMSKEELERVRKTADAVKRFREADEDKREKIEQELHDLLGEAFDVDMAARKKSLDTLKKRVDKLTAALEKRTTARDEIIAHRIKGIQLDADGLGYPKPGMAPISPVAPGVLHLPQREAFVRPLDQSPLPGPGVPSRPYVPQTYRDPAPSLAPRVNDPAVTRPNPPEFLPPKDGFSSDLVLPPGTPSQPTRNLPASPASPQ